MKELEFKKLLFKTAFCCIACDGHIDDKEIEEMKYLDKNTAYFEDTDLSAELEQLINDLNNKGKRIVNDLFESIKKSDLNFVQELLLLEVSLRLIYSDNKIDENEVKFLKYLKSKLKVYDSLIIERFGSVELLFGNKYTASFKTNDHLTELLKGIKIPELKEIKNIDLSK